MLSFYQKIYGKLSLTSSSSAKLSGIAEGDEFYIRLD